MIIQKLLVVLIPSFNLEKKAYARHLLKMNIPYREIQEELHRKFGNGMSNTTLQKLQEELSENIELQAENQKLKQELALYKNLYFELLEVMKKKLT